MEFTAPSGAEVVINGASWRDAKALKRAIAREIVSAGSLDLRAILLSDASEAVDAAIMACLARCLYKKEKIVETTFDSLETRQDYYEIVMACAEVNLAPLWDGLCSAFKKVGLLKKQAEKGQ